MALSAVESLIALSDTICPSMAQASPVGHGNFFGPWLTDSRWSSRKLVAEPTVSLKKKVTYRSNQLSKSLPRRLSLFTSPNINTSPYGAQRSASPADDSLVGRSKLRLTTRAKTFVTSNGNRKQVKDKRPGRKSSKITGKGKRGEEEFGEEEEEEEDAVNASKHLQFQKPSLPALITLTSNTNDTRSTFALGRQLEIPLPKVYVSVAQKQSAKVTPRASSASLPVSMSRSNSFSFGGKDQGIATAIMYKEAWQDRPFPRSHINNQGNSLSYINNGGGRDVSQCRAEALKRALEMRNPPPPTHNYEDISQHMRHYRIHCTVLGTGRFSMANESEERDVKPVQWQDLFPHRPLTAVGSVADVPIFRFSVADFRIQTAPSAKGNRVTPPPAPRSATPRYLAHSGETTEHKETPANHTKSVDDGNSSEASTNSEDENFVTADDDRLPRVNSDFKSGSVKLEERFARASRIASVTMCEDRTERAEKSAANKQLEDNEYMQYLRAKNGSTTQSIITQKTPINPNKGQTFVNSNKIESKYGNQNAEAKQCLATTEDEEGECFHPKMKKKVNKEPKVRKGSNFSLRKCDGQYGPSMPFARSSTDFASKGRHCSSDIHQAQSLPTPRLVVDADRLKESVDVKIDEGERKLRSSLNEAALKQIIYARGNKKLWQKIRRRDTSFPNVSSFKNQQRSIPKPEESVENSCLYTDERSSHLKPSYLSDEDDDIDENDIEDETKAAVTKPHNSIGLVTSYDFKGYVEAIRAKTDRYMENENEPEDEIKIRDYDSADQTPSKAGSFVVSKKRNWRPKESRVRSVSRGGKYRTRYPKMSEMRPRPHDSNSDDGDGFPQISTSARLRYKPTSPATSAFVIAAPPNCGTTSIGGRSVVLPLEEFMEMAVEGKDQSFADWKTCLNNSSPGLMSRPQFGAGQNSRSDGLLKVVSFATPVNQFIFAKKITFDSTDNLGIFPFNSKKQKKLKEGGGELAGKCAGSSRYRLKLSDFGLPRTFRKNTINKEGCRLGIGKTNEMTPDNSNTDKNEKPNKKDEELDTFKGNRHELNISNDSGNAAWNAITNQDGVEQNVKLEQCKNTNSMQIIVDLPQVKESSVTRGTANSTPTTTVIKKETDAKEKSKQAKYRSVSAEAHACLRKEILRLMEHRKSTTVNENENIDPQGAAVEGRKNWTGITSIKGKPAPKTSDEQGKEISSNQTVTANSPNATGAFTFRFNRQGSSLSPSRLTLKHRVRRYSDRERSLSPSRIHGYFQRRRSTPEVRQEDLDLDLPPLTIQGGGFSRPPSEKVHSKIDFPVPDLEENKAVTGLISDKSNGIKSTNKKEIFKTQTNFTALSDNSLVIKDSKMSNENKTDFDITKEACGVDEKVAESLAQKAETCQNERKECDNKNRDAIGKTTTRNAEENNRGKTNVSRKAQTSPKKATKYVRFSIDM
ncbi:hypothetical protein ElyMa_002743200 [Elysia marginata]|uniref:Uncharacterized protein n=1 Tax=Elysia marginata TaxID=1093978 RepID=A0AAV4HKZ0_9GAST|nr:hypothetical protein ElyMa_002743200 [Elysia marginata]